MQFFMTQEVTCHLLPVFFGISWNQRWFASMHFIISKAVTFMFFRFAHETFPRLLISIYLNIQCLIISTTEEHMRPRVFSISENIIWIYLHSFYFLRYIILLRYMLSIYNLITINIIISLYNVSPCSSSLLQLA